MSAKPTYLDELITRLEDNESIEPNLLRSASNQIDGMFTELAQLRADLQAAQERITWLTSDIGESGLAAINRLIAACERGDIAQQAAPDLSIARDEILRQARQLGDARKALHDLACIIPVDEMLWHTWLLRQADIIDSWLAANPAPSPEQEQS